MHSSDLIGESTPPSFATSVAEAMKIRKATEDRSDFEDEVAPEGTHGADGLFRIGSAASP